MIEKIFELYSTELLIGLLLCICAALIGVILVLKRFSMIGDGLSHVSFSIFAIAICLNLIDGVALYVTIPVTVLFAYLIMILGNKTKIKGDSAIALISTSSLAISYIVLYLTNNAKNIDSFLFGSLTSVDHSFLYILIPVTLIILLFFILFYNRIFSIVFDESFAKTCGINTKLYDFIFSTLTAIVICLGMRILGTLLISAIIVFPALSSMRLSNSFKKVMILSVIISIICYLFSFFVFYNLPLGPIIVVVNFIVFLICSCVGFFIKRSK